MIRFYRKRTVVLLQETIKHHQVAIDAHQQSIDNLIRSNQILRQMIGDLRRRPDSGG